MSDGGIAIIASSCMSEAGGSEKPILPMECKRGRIHSKRTPSPHQESYAAADITSDSGRGFRIKGFGMGGNKRGRVWVGALAFPSSAANCSCTGMNFFLHSARAAAKPRCFPISPIPVAAVLHWLAKRLGDRDPLLGKGERPLLDYVSWKDDR
jgi:hypothetical protein